MPLLVVVEVGRRRGSEQVVVVVAEVDVDVVVVARVEVEVDQVVAATDSSMTPSRRLVSGLDKSKLSFRPKTFARALVDPHRTEGGAHRQLSMLNTLTRFQNSLHMPPSSVVVLFAWVVSRTRAFGGEETPAFFFCAKKNQGHARGEQCQTAGAKQRKVKSRYQTQTMHGDTVVSSAF